MTTLSDLGAAIDSLLQHPRGPRQFMIGHTAEKAYEAYVFCLCLRAARELGATIVLDGNTGSPTPFIFRGSPGKLYSTHKNYGYAAFDLNGIPFEVHAGVEASGTSEMAHELDVCIIKGGACERSRQDSVDPPARSITAHWECKFYSTPLNKNLGRAFVGLADDFGSNVCLKGFCTNGRSGPLSSYFRPKRRPYLCFDLTPLQAENEEMFVNQLKAELRKLTGA